MASTSQIQVTKPNKRKNVTIRLEPSLIDRLDERALEMVEPTRTGLIENVMVDWLDNPNPNSQTEELQDSLELENPENENDDLTPQEQGLFDSGFEIGRDQGLEEGREEGKRDAIIQLSEELANRPDPHSCEFLPWRETCVNGKCDNVQPKYLNEQYKLLGMTLGEKQKLLP